MPIVYLNLFEAAIQQQQKNQQQSAKAANDIIARNSEENKVKASIVINPKSASDIMNSHSNSASNASQNFGNQSQNAGARHSSLTNAYVTKPTKVPARLGTNPTFAARGI